MSISAIDALTLRPDFFTAAWVQEGSRGFQPLLDLQFIATTVQPSPPAQAGAQGAT